MKRFENKAALVTGAAKGIGFATAERLCAEGASVVVADYDLEGAKKACQTLNDAGGNAVAPAGHILSGDGLWRSAEQGDLRPQAFRYGGI